MADLAGQIDIQLRRADSVAPVAIVSSRPVMASRVFAGKPVADLATRLPLLFSVCGTAQALACARACEAALGCRPRQAALQTRRLLLHAETAKEHLWRLLLDWPRTLEPIASEDRRLHPLPADGGDERPVAAAMRAFLTLRATLSAAAEPFLPGAKTPTPPTDAVLRASEVLVGTAARQVFGLPPEVWLAEVVDTEALRRWASETDSIVAWLVRTVEAAGLAGLGRHQAPMLPDIGPDLLARLAPRLRGGGADDFVTAPSLDGRPAETTPFARELGRRGLVAELAQQLGNGLLPRLAALLAELARGCVVLAGPDPQTQRRDPAEADEGLLVGHPSEGYGAAAAARGLLVHRVELARDCDIPSVADYRILAPTEWNFHAEGVVAGALGGLVVDQRQSDRQLLARARLLVTAVDPCVDFALRVA